MVLVVGMMNGGRGIPGVVHDELDVVVAVRFLDTRSQPQQPILGTKWQSSSCLPRGSHPKHFDADNLHPVYYANTVPSAHISR